MLFEELKNISEHIKDNELVKLKLDNLNSIFLYPRSVSIYGNSYLFIANENTEK